MDIELTNIISIKQLKEIDFGLIFNYKLNINGTFYILNSSSISTQELCKITQIL